MSLLQSSALVRQLANRLETSNVAERISALQELQTLARSIPHVVGELGKLVIIIIIYNLHTLLIIISSITASPALFT